ncbi:DUF11 domain-containing protein [Actinokineospora bangkokensis]|uniref:DUF11 domain-containing protein n=1 Tax=Actinokineospora bangkokensis TaxID=1193682 RepID=A0A1Q9LJU1_9PSEU|nr:DUF11 domain-containing protein [Actinokineospora bangkokensis]OLR92264.1 hypothetical protein BJP25_23405 [Actinokineospora bangkokensis]
MAGRRRLWSLVAGAIAFVLVAVGVGPVVRAVAQAGPTPFPCDATYYLMQPSGAGTGTDDLGRVTFPAAGQPGGGRFERISTPDFKFNAIGYNHRDGLVYGLTRGEAVSRLFRVGANGVYDVLGVPLDGGLPMTYDQFLAGTFLVDGTYAALVGSGGPLVRFDITQRPPRIISKAPLAGIQSSDIAVNPYDDGVYAYDQNGGGLVRIDPGSGAITRVGGSPGAEVIRAQGSTWIDGQGRITLLAGDGGADGQDTFYQADFTPGTRTYGPLRRIGVEPGLSGAGDGANCAYRATFDKTAAPTSVDAGGEVTYTYRVVNGSEEARSYTFRDTLPDGRRFVGDPTVDPPIGSVAFNASRSRLTISGLQLPRGNDVTITARVSVPADAPTATVYNQAFLTGGGLPGDGLPSDFPGTADPADATPLVVRAQAGADLRITKTVGGSSANQVQQGGRFTYTLTVTNDGPAASPASTITDDVPAPLTPRAASDGGTTSGRTVTWVLGPIPARGSITRTLEVSADGPAASSVSNTATVTPGGGVPDPNPGNNTSTPPVSTTITTPQPTADLAISKQGPDTAPPGGDVVYRILVDNLGPSAATGTQVVDRLPDGFTPVSASAGGTINGQTVTWNPAAIPVDAAPIELTVVARAPVEGGTGRNTATITTLDGGPADPVPGNNTSNEVVTEVTPSADLVVTKRGPDTVQPNQSYDYAITVDNLGPSTAQSTVVTDRIPDGLVPVSASDGGVIDGQTVTWNLGAVPAAGGPRPLTVTVRAPAEKVQVANRVTATSTTPDPDPRTNTSEDVPTEVVPSADLVVTKEGPESVPAGSTFEYRVTVDNLGPSTAESTVVTDRVPDGLVPVSASDGGVVNGQTVTWNLGAVPAADGPRPLTITVRAPAEAVRVANRVVVTSPTPDPDPGSNTSQDVPTEVVARADLQVTKSGPAEVEPNQEFPYAITVDNLGPSTAQATVVTDRVPDGLVPVSASDGGVIDGQTVTWNLGAVPAADGPRTLTLVVRAPAEGARVGNTVVVGSPTPDPDPGDNTSEIVTTEVVPRADLAVTKTGKAEVVPNEEFSYAITVDNLGPSTATGVVVTDRVPDGLVVLGASDGGVVQGQTVTWNLGSIPAAEGPRPLSVRVRAPAEGLTVDNTVSATSTTTDPEPGNNTSTTVRTVVVPESDLSIVKTAPAEVVAGQPFDYTITVTNRGPSTSTSSVVTDRVPDGFTPVSASDGGTVDGADVRWSLGTLPPNGTAVRTIRVTAPAEGGVGDNVASVRPGPGAPRDPNPANDDSPTIRTTATPSADLAITKTGPATVVAGSRFTYTITVDNLGPSTSTSSVVTDRIPDGFTPVSASDGGTIDGQVVTWALGAIPVTAPPVVRTVDVLAPDEGGTASNVASVVPGEGAPDDPNPDNDRNRPQVTVAQPSADLSVVKTGLEFADAGTPFDWTVTLTNAGPSTARQTVLTDTVPAGFTVGTVPGATTAPGPGGTTVVTWALGDVPPGQTRFTVPVTAPATAGSGRNTAVVRSSTDDPDDPGDLTGTNTVQVRGFTLAKAVTPPTTSVRPGEVLTYSITATNGSTVAYDQAHGLASFRDDLTGVLDDAEVVSVDPAAEITRDDTGFTWTGPIPAGQSRTITVAVRVDSPTDDGDDVLRNTVVGGTNCATGSTAPECSPATVPVRELGLVKTVDRTVVSPGEAVTFTVAVTNTGAYDYTEQDPAAIFDDLTGVLDDAVFGDLVVDPEVGTPGPAPTREDPVLTWSGPLAAGGTVRLVYTATVSNPQTGDGRIVNLVSSGEDPRCLPADPCGPAEVPLVKAFLLDKTVDRSGGVAPGDEVTYTITVTNSGQVPYTDGAAAFTEDLSGVLDDAAVVEATADSGTLTRDGTDLRWAGDLPLADPPGTAGATITVRARVFNPDLDGDHFLVNVVTGSTNCPPPAGSPTGGSECRAGDPLPVKGLTVAKSSDRAVVRAGAPVAYTITVTNTGEVDYTDTDPATITDDLSGVLDDATYAGGAEASTGEPVTVNGTMLTWRGPLAKGATTTITYRVTVALPGTGDHLLRNTVTAPGSNCAPEPDEGTTPDPACSGGDDGQDGTVRVAEVRIEKKPTTDTATVGDTFGYAVTITNVGTVDYLATEPPTTTPAPSSTAPPSTAPSSSAPPSTVPGSTAPGPGVPATPAGVGPATWTDDLTAVLDDATYLDDAQSTTGSTTYASPRLTWSGPLPVGGAAATTYSVRVNDPASGDGTLLNAVTGPESNCACAVTTPVQPKPVAPTKPGGLASTGADVGWLLVTGFGLLLLGSAALAYTRRRTILLAYRRRRAERD